MRLRCSDDCPGDDTCEHNKVCMCGARMAGHDEPLDSGHYPVSMHSYYSRPPVKADDDVF